MLIVEIEPDEAGAHRNQTYHGVIPDGWALLPQSVNAEAFPYGTITLAQQTEIPTIESWEAGTPPKPVAPSEPSEPSEPSTPQDDSVWDALDAAYTEGVNAV